MSFGMYRGAIGDRGVWGMGYEQIVREIDARKTIKPESDLVLRSSLSRKILPLESF
jgi:hypothetical protein